MKKLVKPFKNSLIKKIFLVILSVCLAFSVNNGVEVGIAWAASNSDIQQEANVDAQTDESVDDTEDAEIGNDESSVSIEFNENGNIYAKNLDVHNNEIVLPEPQAMSIENNDGSVMTFVCWALEDKDYNPGDKYLLPNELLTITFAAKYNDLNSASELMTASPKKLGAPNSANSKFYYNPCNYDRANPYIPAGKLNGEGTDINNSQLLLSSAIEKAKSKSVPTDVCFMDYFKQFNESTSQEIDYDSVNLDGQNLYFRVEDSTYVGQLFRFDFKPGTSTQRSYYLNNFNFSTSTSSSGEIVGKQVVRFAGGKAKLENTTMDQNNTIAFELDKYFGSDKSLDTPLEIVNAKSDLFLEFDMTNISALFESYGKASMPIAKVDSASQGKIKITPSQDDIFDFYYIDGILYVSLKITYSTSNNVFISASGNDSNDGHNHLCPVQTMQRALDILNSNNLDNIILVGTQSLQVVDADEEWIFPEAKDKNFFRWGGTYYTKNESGATETHTNTVTKIALAEIWKGKTLTVKNVTTSNIDFHNFVTRGGKLILDYVTIKDTILPLSGDEYIRLGAGIYATNEGSFNSEVTVSNCFFNNLTANHGAIVFLDNYSTFNYESGNTIDKVNYGSSWDSSPIFGRNKSVVNINQTEPFDGDTNLKNINSYYLFYIQNGTSCKCTPSFQNINNTNLRLFVVQTTWSSTRPTVEFADNQYIKNCRIYDYAYIDNGGSVTFGENFVSDTVFTASDFLVMRYNCQLTMKSAEIKNYNANNIGCQFLYQDGNSSNEVSFKNVEVHDSTFGSFAYTQNQSIIKVEDCKFYKNTYHYGMFYNRAYYGTRDVTFKNVEMYQNQSNSNDAATQLIYLINDYVANAVFTFDNVKIHDNYGCCGVFLTLHGQIEMSNFDYYNNGATTGPCNWSKALVEIRRYRGDNVYKQTNMKSCKIYSNNSTHDRCGLELVNTKGTLASSLTDVEVKDNVAASSYFSGIQYYCNSTSCKGITFDGVTVSGNKGKNSGVCFNNTYLNEVFDPEVYSTIKNTEIANNIGYGAADSWHGFANFNCSIDFGENVKIDKTTNQVLYQNSKYPFSLSAGRFDDEGQIISNDADKWVVDFSLCDSQFLYVGANVFVPSSSVEITGIDDASIYIDTFVYTNLESSLTTYPFNKKIVLGKKGVWVDGVNGNNSNDGLSPDTPVLDMNTALDKLSTQWSPESGLPPAVNIKNKITVSNTQSWDGDVNGSVYTNVYRWPYFNGSMISVEQNGDLTLDNLRFVGTDSQVIYACNGGTKYQGCMIEVNKGSLKTANPISVWFLDEPGVALYVKSGNVDLRGVTCWNCLDSNGVEAPNYNANYQKATVWVEGDNSSHVYLEGFEFRNCDKPNGALSVDGSSCSDIDINSCAFLYCESSNSGILSILGGNSPVVNIRNCTMYSNTTGFTKDSRNKDNICGIIYNQSYTSDLTIDSCKIYENERATYVDGAVTGYTSENSIVSCDGASNNSTFSKITVTNTNLDFIDVENTKLYLGGDIKPFSGGSTSTFKFRQSGDIKPIPAKLIKDQSLNSNNYYKIYITSGYLGEIVVEHDDTLLADKYLENFVVDDACLDYCPGLNGSAAHDVVAKIKHIYLDGVNGNNENSGLSSANAVKDFSTAKDKLKNQGAPGTSATDEGSCIVICGTVEISEEQTWEFLNKDPSTDELYFENTSGNRWQPKLKRDTNGVAGDGSMIVLKSGYASSVNFEMDNFIIDGAHDTSNLLLKAVGCNNGFNFKTTNTQISNFDYGVIYAETSRSRQNSWNHSINPYNWNLEFDNTSFTNNGNESNQENLKLINILGSINFVTNNCLFKDNYFKTSISARNDYVNNVTGADDAYQAPHHMIFNNTDFYNNYGHIYVNSGNWSRDDKNSWDDIQFNGCSYYQDRSLYWTMWNNLNRFFYSRCLYQLNIEGCNFSINPNSSTANEQLICLEAYYRFLNVKNTKFENIENPSGSLIFAFKSWDHTWKGGITFDNVEARNCFRNSNSLNWGALFYIRGDGATRDLSNPYDTFEINDCKIYRDENARYKAGSVFRCFNLDMKLTGNTDISGLLSNSDGVIVNESTNIYIGPDVRVHDCQRVLYLQKTNSWNLPFIDIHGRFDHNTNADYLFYFTSNGNDATQANVVFHDDFIAEYNQVNDTLFYDCGPHIKMNKCQIVNNKCGRMFYKQEFYTLRDFELNGTIIKNNQIFYNNKYSQGGFIYASYAPKLTLNDVVFEDNYLSYGTTLQGSIWANRATEIYINGGSYKAPESSNSSTRYYGGFAYIKNATDRGNAVHPWGIFIKDAHFSNFGNVANLNNSNNRGGFIYNDYGNVEIGGSTTIEGCRSYNGGLFYCRGDLYNAEGKLGNIKIYDGVSITDSYAYLNGGIYYMENGGQIDFYGSAKINNTKSGNCGGFGYSAGSSVVNVYGSTSVVESTSNRGGCFYADGSSTVNIKGNSQIKNSVSTYEGGAGYFSSSSILNVSQNAKVINNTSATYGGAFYLNSSTVGNANFSGGYIMSNQAAYGGAIYSLRPVSIDGAVVSNNITTTEDKFTTDNIHMLNTLSIYSNFEQLEDTIFLGDKNYPICQHEPFQASNNFNVTVAGVGKTDASKVFKKEDVVVTYKNGSLSSVEPYLNFYNLNNQSFNLINGNGSKKGEIILGINVFVDGESGNDANSGQDPDNAVLTIEKALSLLGTTPGAIYITGTVKYESGSNTISPQEGQVIQRFDGFDVSGKEYTAFKGTMIEVCGGTLTLSEHASISGSNVVDSESIIAVDENATLELDGASLMLNIAKDFGGAIYNKGTVSIKSNTSISSCYAKEGASIYHDGQNLWVDGTDLVIENEIYLTTPSSDNYQTINIVDPNNFYPKAPFIVDVQSPEAPRHIVESTITSKDLDKSDFTLDVGPASVFTLSLDNSSKNVLYLTDQITVYVDPQNASSGNGLTADSAVKTLKEAYEKIFESHIVYGRIIIVNCIYVTDSNVIMSNSLYSDSTGAIVEGFSEISFWRYSKPEASIEGFSKNTNKDSLFMINSGSSMTLNGVNVCGHKYDLSSPDVRLTAPGVKDTKSLFDVQNGGVLNLGTESQVSLIENSASQNGGAIVVQNGGTVNLRHTLIQDIDAKNGAGIYCSGTLNADPLDSGKQNNSFIDLFASENGGCVYVTHTGVCNLFSNTEMSVSNVANYGSSIYNDGELHMKGQQTIENEVFLCEDRYIQVDEFLNNLAKQRWCINMENPLEATQVVKYYEDCSGLVSNFPLHQDVAASFVLDSRPSDNTVLELQTRFSVYIDGVNGSDSNSGMSPQNAVQTLSKAYSVLKELDTNVLYVVNTVTISNSATITNIKYSDDASSITLDVPIMIQRYSKPDAASTLGWTKDSFKGLMFSLVGGDLTLKNVVLDGHSNAVTKGNMANISPAVDAISPIISLVDNASGANSSLSLMSASKLVSNKNVTANAQGCAVYSNNGIVHMDRTEISNMLTSGDAHGSAIYTNQVIDWSGQSNIGDNEIYLCNNEISGVRGAYISLDIDNPNGLNASGQGNKIKIDMDTEGYSQNKRVLVQYGYSVEFKDDLRNLYVLKQTVPESAIYTTDSNTKQILILTYFNINVTALKDGVASYSGWTCILHNSEDSVLHTTTLNAQGKCTFGSPTVKLVDGTYFVEILNDGISYKTTDAVISDGDLNYDLRTYSVKFDKAGHEFALDDQVVVHGAKASKPGSPVVKGYNFINWYSDDKCSAGYEFDFEKTSIVNTTTIYSKWQAKTTYITLDKRGGNGGINNITATYDSPMPTILPNQLPTRVGYPTYGFVGYYSKEQHEDGKITPGEYVNEYIANSGLSSRNWDIDEPSYTLYAHWVTPVACSVIFPDSTEVMAGTIEQALTLINSDAGKGLTLTLKMLNNTIEGNLDILEGRTVTLDLNGFYISAPTTSDYTFSTAAPFTIVDTSAEQNGEIKGGNPASGSCIRSLAPSSIASSINIKSGTINTDFPVGINAVQSPSTDLVSVNIDGGNISAGECGLYTTSNFSITGGNINCKDKNAIVWYGDAPVSAESVISGGITLGKVGIISTDGDFSNVVINNGCIAKVEGGWLQQQIGNRDSQSSYSLTNAIGYSVKEFSEDVVPNKDAKWSAYGTIYHIKYKAGLNATGEDKDIEVPISNRKDPNCYRDCILLDNESVGIAANYTYEFLGWSTNVNSKIPEYLANGIVQAPVWTGSDWADLVVYAICDYKKSEVSFDLGGGQNPPDNVIAQYNHAMPALSQTPTKEGWTFLGFYDNNFKKYYSSSGSSVTTWDKLVDTQLSAHWIKSDLSKSYTYGSKLKDIVTDQASVTGNVCIDSESSSVDGTFAFTESEGQNLYTYDQTHPSPLGVSTTFTVGGGHFAGEVFATTIAITVDKRDITAYDITCEDKIYDGQTEATLNLSVVKFTNLVGSDSPTISEVTGAFVSADAGTNKTVNISYSTFSLSDSNYNLDTANSQATTAADITQREVSVASGIKANPKTYDGNADSTLIFTDVVFANKVEGDELTINSVTGAFVDPDARENKTINLNYSGAVLSNLNYRLSGSGNQSTTTATINKKRTIVSVEKADNKTYDGNNTATAYLLATSGISGESFEFSSINATFDTKDAGVNKFVTVNSYDYSVTGGRANKNNYDMVMNTSTTSADIYKKEIVIVWGDLSFDYDKTAKLPTATAKAESLVSGETVNITTTTDGDKIDAGTYTVTASDLYDNESKDFCKNYKLPTANTTQFTINKINLADNSTISVVGTYIYTGNQIIPEFTFKDVNGDEWTLDQVKDQFRVDYIDNINTNSNTYKPTIKLTCNGSTVNYSGEKTCEFIISPYDISGGLTLNQINLGSYTGLHKGWTAEQIGLKYGLNVLDVSDNGDVQIAWTDDVNTTTPEKKAKLTITAVNKDGANYKGSISYTYDIAKYNNGVTDIDAFDFTLPGDAEHSWVYDANSRDANVKLKDVFTSTMDQDQACGTITVLYSRFNKETGTYDAPTTDAPQHAGTYKVYITVSGGNNFGATDNPLEYKEAGQETVIKVNPSNVYVSSGAEGVDKIYDMTDAATIVSTDAVLQGIYPGDECTIDNVSGTFDLPDVGDDIHISLDYNSCVLSNPDYVYDFDYAGADHQLDSSASIAPFELTKEMIELVPSKFEYDGSSHSPKIIVRHNGSELTEGIDYLCEKTDEIYVSTYTVSVIGQGNYSGTVDVDWSIVGEYIILEGQGEIYYKGEYNNLFFRCNGAFNDFSYIEIDGVAVSPDVYRVFEGSTCVELYSDFLETQEAGMHTLTFIYDTGGSASANYEVVEIPELVKSWDYNYLYVFMFVLIELLGLGLLLYWRKNRN